MSAFLSDRPLSLSRCPRCGADRILPPFVVGEAVPAHTCSCKAEGAVDDSDAEREKRGTIFDRCVVDAQIALRNQVEGPADAAEAARMLKWRTERMASACEEDNFDAYTMHLLALMAIARTMVTDGQELREIVLGLLDGEDE